MESMLIFVIGLLHCATGEQNLDWNEMLNMLLDSSSMLMLLNSNFESHMINLFLL